MARVTKTAAQRKLAGALRRHINEAADGNRLISRSEQTQLPAFLQAEANALRDDLGPGARVTTGDLMDRAMQGAMATWARFNPTDTSLDARYLSLAEVNQIAQDSPALGWLTMRAYQVAMAEAVAAATPPAPASSLVPDVTLSTTNHPSAVIRREGDEYVITEDLSAFGGARAPDPRPVATLSFDGHSVELGSNWAGSLLWYDLDTSAPDGYWADRVASERLPDGRIETRIVVEKDPPGALSEAEMLANAREGLVPFLRDERIHERDWQSMIGGDWQDALSHGILDGVEAFGDPAAAAAYDVTVYKGRDTVTFTGPGPFELYTEVAVDKMTGDLKRIYVEID